MFNGFELYSRWVPLHLDLLQNIKEHQTPPKGRKAAQLTRSYCTETCSKFLQRYLKSQTFSLNKYFAFLNALIDVEGSLFKKRPFISFFFNQCFR